jgi:hypothetical protein
MNWNDPSQVYANLGWVGEGGGGRGQIAKIAEIAIIGELKNQNL